MISLADEFEKPACQFRVQSFERFVNSFCGFLIVEIQMSYAEIEIGLGVAVFDFHCLFKSLNGLRPATELAQSHAKVVMRLRPIRLELNRLQAGADF